MGWLRKKQKPNIQERRRPTTSSPAVFSYYARGASPSSQNTGRRDNANNTSKKTYKPRLGHVPSYLALVAIIIGVVYACTLQAQPKIIVVNTPDTIHRDAKAYQDAVQAIWKKSPLNRTKFTVSTPRLQREIAAQFSELSSVQIELPLLGRRPTVILTPTRPSLQLISANGSFYVGATGTVMARTTEVKQNELKNLPLIRDETGAEAEPGKNILSGSQTAFLTTLYAQLAAQTISVESITLPSQAAQQADVRITGVGYYVKFSLASDPRQAVGTYLAAKAKLDTDHVIPAEYMDVRVEEKVFYR